MLAQAPACEVADELELVGHHLVENRADDLDAGLIEQGLVEGDLVDGLADAAGGDQDAPWSASTRALSALEAPKTEPTPAWPEPSTTTMSLP